MIVKLKADNMLHTGFCRVVGDDRALLLGALPGELVLAKQIGKKKGKKLYKCLEPIEPHRDRVEEKDSTYLETSPLQIASSSLENKIKVEILKDLYEGSDLATKINLIEMSDHRFLYRNKIEFSVYSDDGTLHPAFNMRGTRRGKVIIERSAIASEHINIGLPKFRDLINKVDISRDQIKGGVLRSYDGNKVYLGIYLTEEKDSLTNSLFDVFSGEFDELEIYYSDPRSPAFRADKLLIGSSDSTVLNDIVGCHSFSYLPGHFFQVNIPVFERIIEDIGKYLKSTEVPSRELVDFYSGVGTIGLNLSNFFDDVSFIESSKGVANMVKVNAESAGLEVGEFSVYEDRSEDILDKTDLEGKAVVVDPPRAGLHRKVIQKLIDEKPAMLIYVSCNPVTHRENSDALLEAFKLKHISFYNQYPCTPHMEVLSMFEPIS